MDIPRKLLEKSGNGMILQRRKELQVSNTLDHSAIRNVLSIHASM